MDLERMASEIAMDRISDRLACRFVVGFDSEHDFTRNEWESYEHDHPGTEIHPHIVDNTRHPHPEQPGVSSPHPVTAPVPVENHALVESVAEDHEYMGAVESMDMVSAQRMVDGAARKKGYTIEAFHGSPEKNITTINRTQTAHGFFLTPDKETAKFYTYTGDGSEGRVYRTYLKADKVLDLTDDAERLDFFNKHMSSGNSEWVVHDNNSGSYRKPNRMEVSEGIDRAIESVGGAKLCEEFGVDGSGYPDDELYSAIHDEADEDALMDYLGSNGYLGDHARKSDPEVEDMNSEYGSQNFYMNYQDDVMQMAQNAGHDMVIFDDPSSTGESISYVVFDPRRIKSAEPVERDNNGKVVPVSKRFDEESDDLRGGVDEHLV